jgi:hypothetical protein
VAADGSRVDYRINHAAKSFNAAEDIPNTSRTGHINSMKGNHTDTG